MRAVTRRVLMGWLVVTGLMASTCHGERIESPFVAATGGDAARGPDALTRYGCVACHTIPGVRGPRGLVGPPLTAFGRRAYIAGRLPNQPASLVAWIRDPQAIDPLTAMPRLEVSEQDARDIAAYLYGLR